VHPAATARARRTVQAAINQLLCIGHRRGAVIPAGLWGCVLHSGNVAKVGNLAARVAQVHTGNRGWRQGGGEAEGGGGVAHRKHMRASRAASKALAGATPVQYLHRASCHDTTTGRKHDATRVVKQQHTHAAHVGM
jgi:hypothetical protein